MSVPGNIVTWAFQSQLRVQTNLETVTHGYTLDRYIGLFSIAQNIHDPILLQLPVDIHDIACYVFVLNRPYIPKCESVPYCGACRV
jgi:hypothetical protein